MNRMRINQSSLITAMVFTLLIFYSHLCFASIDPLLGKADKLMKQKNWRGAIECLEKYVKSKPKDTEMIEVLGECYYNLYEASGKSSQDIQAQLLDRAVKSFERALSLKPKGELLKNCDGWLLQCLNRRALVELDKGDFENAQARNDLFKAKYENEVLPYFNEGLILFIRGRMQDNPEDMEAARKIWKKAQDINPLSSTARMITGIEHTDGKNFEQAIESLKAAVDSGKVNYIARNFLAKCYIETRQDLDALKVIEESEKINPHCFITYEIKGDINSLLGDDEKAQEAFEECLKKCPGNYYAKSGLARIFYKKGDIDKAAEYMIASVSLQKIPKVGDKEVTKIDEKDIAELTKEPEQARKMKTRVEQKLNDIRFLGVILLKKEEFGRASLYLKDSKNLRWVISKIEHINLPAATPQESKLLALSYEGEGKFSNAINELDDAEKNCTSDSNLSLYRGMLEYEMKRYWLAEGAFQKAVKNEKNDKNKSLLCVVRGINLVENSESKSPNKDAINCFREASNLNDSCSKIATLYENWYKLKQLYDSEMVSGILGGSRKYDLSSIERNMNACRGEHNKLASEWMAKVRKLLRDSFLKEVK